MRTRFRKPLSLIDRFSEIGRTVDESEEIHRSVFSQTLNLGPVIGRRRKQRAEFPLVLDAINLLGVNE